MRLKLLLILTIVFTTATLLFGGATFRTTQHLGVEQQAQLIKGYFAESIDKLNNSAANSQNLLTTQAFLTLPDDASMYFVFGDKKPTFLSGNRLNTDIALVVSEAKENFGSFEERGLVHVWFQQELNVEDTFVIAIYNTNTLNHSFFESITSTLIISMIFVLWISVWASQYIGNLIQKVEDQKVSLNEKNTELSQALSAQKQTSLELETARDIALEASQTKSTFLANMSHELRTPLNAIIGYSEMLLDEADELDEQVSLDLDKINSAGKHLLGLINDVLDLSKIEAGKMETYAEDIPIMDTLQEVIASMTPLFEQKGNKLELICSEGIGTVESDLTKYRQILFNLLGNANKFTEGGKITLDVAKDDDGKNLITKVVDSGIGMSQVQIKKLFSAFTQADNSTTRKFGGTGLGLTISKHLAQLLGGGIRVESEEGVGSTFIVTILAKYQDPVAQDDHVYVGEQVDPAEVRFGKDGSIDPRRKKVSKILIIDDDATIRDLMQRYLTRQGFYTFTASSADEGIKMAETILPDLITLDVMMPEKDGYQALRELKEIDTLKNVPTIILTMAGNRELGLSLGADEHLDKPLDWKVLMPLITKQLRKKNVSEQNKVA